MAMTGTDPFWPLRRSFVFRCLPDELVARLAHSCDLRTFHPGESVVSRGTPIDAWHIIADGRARLSDFAADSPLMPSVASDGDSLGDTGMVVRAAWPFSARAESQLRVVTLTASAFQAYAAGLEPRLRDEVLRRLARNRDFEFLRHLKLFSHLDVDDLEQLLDSLQVKTCARGDILYREDEPSDTCCIVRRGRLYLLKRTEQSQRRLAVRREGEVLGEIELLYGSARIADAVAATDAEVLVLARDAFDRFVPAGAARTALFELATERLLQYQNMLADPESSGDGFRVPALDIRWVPTSGRLFAASVPCVRTSVREAAGLACLAMIDGFHGRESAWQDRLESLLWERAVPTLMSFSRTAEDCGYFTRIVESSYADLRAAGLPVIVEDDDGTLAVLFAAGRAGVTLSNPARGVRHVDRAAFTHWWSGRVLSLSPPPPARYLAHLRTFAPRLAAIAAAALLVELLNLSGPLASRAIVDRVLVNADVSLLQLLALALAAAVVFQMMAAVLRDYLLAHTTHRATFALQQRFLSHVLHLPQRTLVTRSIADLAVRFRENERLVRGASGSVLTLLVDGIAVLASLAVMAWLSVPAAVIAAVFVAALTAATLVASPVRTRAATRRSAARAALQAHLIEVVSGIAAIKSLLVERSFFDRGRRLMAHTKAAEFAGARLSENVEIVGGALHDAALVAMVAYGARMAAAGQATTGDMVASLGVFGAMTVPLTALLESRNDRQDARAALDGLEKVSSLEVEHASTAAVPPPITGHVTFDRVSFRYPGATDDALADVSFDVLPGQVVAIVGRSGSGKTTLVNLLMGLYVPTSGAIYLDHLDIQGIPSAALRRQLGVVEQQPFVFEGTLRENIAKADPSAPFERVVAAATVAGLHELATSLPRGYDTPIGERGVSLSGGERQRLMIARAMLNSPRLLILDEATSSVDVRAERLIQQNVRQAAAGRTTFVIAHRLSTIRDADVIVVLDRGRVVETGTHAELMAARRLYYYLNTRTV